MRGPRASGLGPRVPDRRPTPSGPEPDLVEVSARPRVGRVVVDGRDPRGLIAELGDVPRDLGQPLADRRRGDRAADHATVDAQLDPEVVADPAADAERDLAAVD